MESNKKISFLSGLQILRRSITKKSRPHFGQRSDPAPGPSEDLELTNELTIQDTTFQAIISLALRMRFIPPKDKDPAQKFS
jgi:hypothetical protein